MGLLRDRGLVQSGKNAGCSQAVDISAGVGLKDAVLFW